MQAYINVILMAVKLFPLVALVITIPFMVVQYHRYGAVLILRMVIVYSFVLYLMCTALLTILPIPATATDALSRQQAPQYIPLNSLRVWLHTTGFQLPRPSTWWPALVTRPAFYILANIAMMVPLGMYLRYYFDCSLGKTLVVAFGFSLILELIQLTGLFGLSPVAYRMFDVDDLLLNTLGGVLGYWLSGPLIRRLPSQQTLNSVAYQKGLRVSVLRSVTAALADWLILAALLALALYVFAPLRRHLLDESWRWRALTTAGLYAGAVLLYFIVGEWLGKGRTPGKRMTHLRAMDAGSAQPPRFSQVLVKYAFLYFGYPSIPLIASLLLIVIVKKYLLESPLFTAGFALSALYCAMVLLVILKVLIRSRQLPHAALSRLRTVSTLRDNAPV